MTVLQQEKLIRNQITESMPTIIDALKLKLNMIQREQETARVYGENTNANMLHLSYLAAESIKTQQLIKKLESK